MSRNLLYILNCQKPGKFLCEIHFNVSTLWNFLHGSLMIRKLSPWRHSFDERYSFIVLSRLKCFLFTCICPHKGVATRERFHFTLSFWCKYYSCITEIIFLPKQSTLCRPHSQDEWCNYRFDAFSRHHCLVLHL